MSRLKKILVVASLIGAFSCLAKAEEAAPPIVQPIGPFSGLNNQDNPLVIPASNAQDLLNVDITPGGRSVKKRKGYGVDYALKTSTSPVHGGHHFYDANGNDIRLWANDVTVSASKNGQAYSVIVTSMTNGSTLQCVDSQGFAWCASSGRDFLLRTDGTNITWFGPPLGTEVAAGPDRLAVANISGDANTIYFSASGDFTNFTVGSQPSSPFHESILAPGSHLTHIRYANGRYLWWKDNSFGYCLVIDQFNVNIVVVSQLIGTLDNSSVENEGLIYFRGSDNHIWVYDGAGLTRLTREITPIVNSSNVRKSNSWTQRTNSDFNSGSGYATFTDTTTTTNTIQLPGAAGAFTSASSGVNLSWTQLSKEIDFFTGNVAAINANVGLNSYGSIMSTNTYHFAENWDVSGNFTFGQTALTTEQDFFGLVNVSTQGYYISAYPTGASTMGVQCGKITGVDTYTTPVVVTGIAYGGSIELQHAANGTINCVANNAVVGTFTDTSYHNMTNVYVGFFSGNPNAYRTAANSYAAYTATGTYYSAVNNAPNITTWDIFGVNDTQPGAGTIKYFVRTATNTFTVLQATGSQTSANTTDWVAQTKSAVVSASTGTYMQMKANFAVDVATDAPTLNNFTFNWFEGTASDKAYATYFDFGVWWSVSYSTSASTNNRVMRYDLLNQTWTLYDVKANGFLIQNNRLYFGDPLTSNTYTFGGSEDDNGSAINAYWKSKDYTNVGPSIFTGYNPSDTPFNKKDYRTLSTFMTSQIGGNLNITYTMDRVNSSTYTVTMLDPNGLLTAHSNYNLPFGTKGYAINVQFGNNAADQPFELLGAYLTYLPGTWYPYP